jgi:hypothetical protein
MKKAKVEETIKKPLWYENKIKRNSQYNKDFMKQVKIAFNTVTESDLIDYLEQQPNKSGYIKTLIIEDMQKKKND